MRCSAEFRAGRRPDCALARVRAQQSLDAEPVDQIIIPEMNALEAKSLRHFLFAVDHGSGFQVDHREKFFEANLL
jgi:hypothetical protein